MAIKFLDRCNICEDEFTDNNKAMINGVEICVVCKYHINNLKDNKNIENLKSSIKYFENKKIPAYLDIKDIMDKAVFNINNPPMTQSDSENYYKQYAARQNEKQMLPPPQTTYQQNSIEHFQQGKSSIWIKGMRIFAWIAFIAVIIGGIAISVRFWEDNAAIGFVIVLGSFIVAFLSVAMIMIFLDMAEDIKAIRNNTQKKD